MANIKRNTTPMPTISKVRASLTSMQTQGERVVARLRQDAERFMARSRAELLKEVRDVERRVLNAFHAANADRVSRLELRVAKLERTVRELRGATAERAA